jgi:hypothetical protein
MQGRQPWTLMYERFGGELIFRPRVSRRLLRHDTLSLLLSMPLRAWTVARDVPAEDICASCSRRLIGGRTMRLTDKVAIGIL